MFSKWKLLSHEKLPLGVTSTLNQGVPARGSREIELSCFVTDRQTDRKLKQKQYVYLILWET